MRFSFSEDQILLQKTLRDFLEREHPPERVRELWSSQTGRSRELWRKLAEVGVPGLLIPEEHGGMGMDEIDLVLLLEETGRAALAEPLLSTAALGAPLIRDLESKEWTSRWLPAIAAGEAIVAVGHPVNPFVSDAHVADLLLLEHEGEIHGLEPGALELTRQLSNDPSRRLFTVRWRPSGKSRLASGETARELLAATLDRGVLGCAAQQLGVTERLIALAVRHACEREQFGVPIGSFQSLKHMLADLQVKLEYARPLVYRAAHSVARHARCRGADVSMAKVAASEAALAAARVALQVHGAIGYTWEHDLHIWMRRAWSLELAWGGRAWNLARVADAVIDRRAPAETFGYSAPGV